MYRILAIILAQFVFIFATSIAQTGKITGKVLNEKTGEVLIGATVSVEGKSKTTQTDQNGVFTLSEIGRAHV